jgi:hypothetical protein
VELMKSWKRAEDLEAAIQSAEHTYSALKAKRKTGLKGR